MTWKEEIKKRSIRRKPQTKIAGLGRATRGRERMLDVDETDLDDDSYEEQLAQSTKEQLLEAIEKLSQKQLVDILIKTRGDIKLRI